MLKNTENTYGLVAKFFHWSMALIMMGLIAVGLYMMSLEYSPFKMDLYYFHKSFGLLILWMIGLRIIWKSINRKPKKIENHQKWEKTLAIVAHVFLYIAMIGMPLSGWLMSSAGGHAVSFFGINMPALVDKNPDIGKAAHQVHTILGYVLTGAIILHGLGALKHHFMDKDETLTRMMASPLRRFGPYVLSILILLFAVFSLNLIVKSNLPKPEKVMLENPSE